MHVRGAPKSQIGVRRGAAAILAKHREAQASNESSPLKFVKHTYTFRRGGTLFFVRFFNGAEPNINPIVPKSSSEVTGAKHPQLRLKKKVRVTKGVD